MQTQNELYHHGILGMKWGKKNGPPYPLDYSKLSYAEREAAKGKAIAKGDVQEASRNIDYFTNNELKAVKERFNITQEINKISASTVKTGKDKFDDLMDKGQRAKKGFDFAVDVYNRAAKVINSLGDPDEKQLPIIGEKQPHRNKADGKTKRELREMMKNPNISTKDMEDIKNRMDAFKNVEESFKKGSISMDVYKDMLENPTKYKTKEWQDFQSVNNYVKNLSGYDMAENLRNEIAEEKEREKEERDIYALYHSINESGELMHYAKGSTKKGARYIKREFKNGRWRYTYPVKSGTGNSDSAKNILTQINDKVKQQNEVREYVKNAAAAVQATPSKMSKGKTVYERIATNVQAVANSAQLLTYKKKAEDWISSLLKK